jgi:hypothetical protein
MVYNINIQYTLCNTCYVIYIYIYIFYTLHQYTVYNILGRLRPPDPPGTKCEPLDGIPCTIHVIPYTVYNIQSNVYSPMHIQPTVYSPIHIDTSTYRHSFLDISTYLPPDNIYSYIYIYIVMHCISTYRMICNINIQYTKYTLYNTRYSISIIHYTIHNIQYPWGPPPPQTRPVRSANHYWTDSIN